MKLPQQSFKILQLLLERPGELVTRDELCQALWPGDTFVDFDHGLNNSIKRIRDALGDSADTPRYIETLPRLGYRFIGGIDVAPAAPSPVATSVSTREILRPARWIWSFFLLLSALALVMAGIAGWWFFPRAKESASVVEIVPLTGITGKQRLPSFSPDGSQVTFKLTSDSKTGNGLYTALVGGDKLLQLTDDPGDCCPVWSPDGQAVAFSRNSEKGLDIAIRRVSKISSTASSVGAGVALPLVGVGIDLHLSAGSPAARQPRGHRERGGPHPRAPKQLSARGPASLSLIPLPAPSTSASLLTCTRRVLRIPIVVKMRFHGTGEEHRAGGARAHGDRRPALLPRGRARATSPRRSG